MTKIAYDTHLHTSYSTDSHTPLSAQLEQAVKLGLKGICVTDHMDYDFPPETKDGEMIYPFVFHPEQYVSEIEACKSMYPSLDIGIGVECGLQTSDSVQRKNHALNTEYPWDYMIGSLHLVDGADPYNASYWEGQDADACVRRYFEQIYENIRLFSEFDSLGHLDYVVRYAPAGYIYEPEKFFDIIDEILSFLIHEDKSLELNTSGLKSAARTQNPHLSILKRYVALGGTFLTIGSDAHTPDGMAYDFDLVPDIIKKAGLHQYVTYHQRKPVFHDL
ncbi:MAG: histidinol-phosphatase HisJ family protein [Lachnospiraceae bacterium]|nr:histidinol-phosphatase HisJ family protein [Lachnospiraceae bacterium]